MEGISWLLLIPGGLMAAAGAFLVAVNSREEGKDTGDEWTWGVYFEEFLVLAFLFGFVRGLVKGTIDCFSLRMTDLVPPLLLFVVGMALVGVGCFL